MVILFLIRLPVEPGAAMLKEARSALANAPAEEQTDPGYDYSYAYQTRKTF